MKALLLASVLVLGFAGLAHADVITSYRAAGMFSDGSTLGGTVGFSQTTSQFLDPQLTNSLISTPFRIFLTNLSSVLNSNPTLYAVNIDTVLYHYLFSFNVTSDQLVGLNSGQSISLQSGALFDLYTLRDVAKFNGGTLTTTDVPEPASLSLLAVSSAVTGLISLGRRRNVSAA